MKPKIMIAGDSISYQRRGGYAGHVMNLHPEWDIAILRQILGYFGNTSIWIDPRELRDYTMRCYGAKEDYIKSVIRSSIPFNDLLVTPKYDVIHLNSGLHDIQMAKSPLTGEMGPVVPIDVYEQNLEYIVNRVRNETPSKLIWASTTPAYSGQRKPLRRSEDVCAYNEVARKVMEKHNVPINDLYTLIMNNDRKKCQSDGLHLNDYGAKLLAKQVSGHISVALKKPEKKRSQE